MNTPSRDKLNIEVSHLGPILFLNGELSNKRQNLIFARNGVGKSFLSRGLRFLDRWHAGENIDEAANTLVSDESPDGKGYLTISQGTETLGRLFLQKNGNVNETGSGVLPDVNPERIFHVFSEDFVSKELREKHFTPDGNIENQIAVDSENLKLEEAQNAVEATEKAESAELDKLNRNFESSKLSSVHNNAGVSKNLTEYRNLILENVLGRWSERPTPPKQSFAEILKDLDSLKFIPMDPRYPETVSFIDVNDIEFEKINESVQKITSPSTVSQVIKQKIEANRDFFEKGTNLLDSNKDACPYCEQSVNSSPTADTIKAYIAYFKDEEALHKSDLRRYWRSLNDKKVEMKELVSHIANQRDRFDTLKRSLPSQRDELLDNCEAEINQVCTVIDRIKDTIESKARTIDQRADLPSGSLDEFVQHLNVAIKKNNSKGDALRIALEKADDERRNLQRSACSIFATEFARNQWNEIGSITKLRNELKLRRAELATQERASPTGEAKVRVAETFEYLLRQFFGKQYVFDRDRFVLKRGDNEMVRGPHQTLSDGEKNAIAFCYFVACIHRKVESARDYRKLVLIFDDPVTSMSYDFVFNIAQTLRYLRISPNGEITTNQGLSYDRTYERPDFIILTHSSYFFNIAFSNTIVSREAAFTLDLNNFGHKLTSIDTYVAPFQHQLQSIFEVAEEDREPDHQTGNAIRSVLEAVGRFCRPDKTHTLSEFLTFLAGEQNVQIRSVLINSLSHGSYDLETPSPDDLKLACADTIEVVERFACGQLALIRGDSDT